MTPSFPIDLPLNTKFMEVDDPLECAMIRLGQPCGNDAHYVFVRPLPSGLHRLIPFCQMCVDDMPDHKGKTWLQELEETIEVI